MDEIYNQALQNLAQNVRTISAQIAQCLTQQNVEQLTAVINSQFNNINQQLSVANTNIQTLFSYQNTFPIPNFVDGEVPSGAINGINTTFNLANTPKAGSVRVFVGGTSTAYGLLALQSVHYTMLNKQIIFQTGYIPATGSWIRAYYRY